MRRGGARCCTKPAIRPARLPRSASRIRRSERRSHRCKKLWCSLPWGRRSSMRRSLGVALWSLVGLLACFLGALTALVGTEAGRTLLARIASAAVQNAVSGTIQVGEVRGSLLTGVVLSDVRMWDPDSTLVAWLPHAELGYNLIDFAAGRIVFMEVRLVPPVVNIVQQANGKTNFAERH